MRTIFRFLKPYKGLFIFTVFFMIADVAGVIPMVRFYRKMEVEEG